MLRRAVLCLLCFAVLCLLCFAGSIYEYTLELASQTSAPSLEKHTAKLAGVVAAQAEELRRQHNKDRLPVPGDARVGNHTDSSSSLSLVAAICQAPAGALHSSPAFGC